MKENTVGSGENYSEPLKEIPYHGSHSSEFNNPIQNNICFWSDIAKISKTGKSLYSDNFSKDTAFIVQRVDGPEAYAAHVKQSGFNSEQLKEMDKLPPGEYVGRFIRGSMSCDLQKTVAEENFLKHFTEDKEFKILPPIILPTERYPWDVIYKPKPDEDGLHILMVESRQSCHTIQVFDFFKI